MPVLSKMRAVHVKEEQKGKRILQKLVCAPDCVQTSAIRYGRLQAVSVKQVFYRRTVCQHPQRLAKHDTLPVSYLIGTIHYLTPHVIQRAIGIMPQKNPSRATTRLITFEIATPLASKIFSDAVRVSNVQIE